MCSTGAAFSGYTRPLSAIRESEAGSYPRPQVRRQMAGKISFLAALQNPTSLIGNSESKFPACPLHLIRRQGRIIPVTYSPPMPIVWKEGQDGMDTFIITFLATVAADVVSWFICRSLDRHFR